LQAKIAVAAGLEYATKSERPWYQVAAEEEIAHFHAVASQPINDDRESKAFAGPCIMVLEDLRNGKNGLDSESKVAEKG
jgi:hypothetical protein